MPLSLLRAQGDMADMMHRFEAYIESNPVEKIYLHLDKPYYAAGEYMYFRAYLTDIHLNQEVVASHIIYVELSDERKEIVRRTLLYSEGTEYAGQFLLPDTLPSANYHLRAYTNWMRNAGEEYFYSRDIYIGHPTERKAAPSIPFDYEVSFFPEGGLLLPGLENRVAFKALANDGFGTDITGILTDEAGNEVCRFNSLHLGMGSFTFLPEKGKTYTATTESKGKTNVYTLPPAVEGTTLSISQTTDSVRLVIKSTNPSANPVRILAQARHTICYALAGWCEKEEEQIWIPKEKFPTGIVQFILFKDSRPVSERLLFVDRKDDLQVSMIPDKPGYGDREKVKLAIQVKDREGKPVEGSFSLSVTDDKVVIPSIREENIKGSLLLDADLKGYIEQPGWYFSGIRPEQEEALDNLLCTQGWTRYEWDDLFAPEKASYYPIEKEFQITGKVTNLIGKPVKDGEVILLGNSNDLNATRTNKEGLFNFSGFNCPDTVFFILQASHKNGQRAFLDIAIDKKDSRAALSVIPKIAHAYTSMPHNYVEQALSVQKFEEQIWRIDLPEIEIKGNAMIQEKKDWIWRGMSGIKYDRRMINDNNILRYELLRMNIASRGVASMYSAPTLYFVNGIETDIKDIEEIPGFYIESIEVIRGTGASLYGARGVSGAILITMRSPSDIVNSRAINTSPGLIQYKPEGYNVYKQFYIPAYDNPAILRNNIPDRRTTVYWNPVIRTSKEGTASVEFYTADQTGSFTYILEGIGANTIISKNVEAEKHRE